MPGDINIGNNVSSTGLSISSGTINVSSGGVAIDATVMGEEHHYTGTMYVYAGGIATNTTVGPNGQLVIYANGTATGIKESGGCVVLEDGVSATFAKNIFSGRVPWMGIATVHSGTTSYRTTIASGGTMYVYSGGLASSATVTNRGSMYISSGGIVSDVDIFYSGFLNISSGGTAKSLIVNEYGSVYVESGATVRDVVLDSGVLTVSSGAVVSDLTLYSGGTLRVASGGKVENLTSKGKGGTIEAADGAIITYKGSKASSSASLVKSPDCDNGKDNYLYSAKQSPTLNTNVYSSIAEYITAPGSVLMDGKGISHEGKSNYVGYGDEVDFLKIRLTNAAQLVFTLEATGPAKLTLWSLSFSGVDKKGDSKYTMKALETVTVKKGQTTASGTLKKAPLLSQNYEYYISVEATDVKKGGDVYYNVIVNNDSVFYSKGKSFDDSWYDFSAKNYDGKGHLGTLTGKKKNLYEDWVGYGDTVDYRKFTLASAAKLSFTVTATEGVTFSICMPVVKSSDGSTTVYNTKYLQTAKLKKRRGDDGYAAHTDGIMLEAGDYYLCVESANPKKGGNADYTVELDTEASAFFTKGNNSDDWNDLAEKGAAGKVGSVGVLDGKKETVLEDWVGFGDAVDYKKFTLASAATVDFAFISGDASKFSVCKLETKESKKGGTTYSLKDLLSVKAKQYGEHDYFALTKTILLEAGDYYFCVESTNAQKGGNADYTVNLDVDTSVFFTKGNNADDWGDMKEKGAAGKVVKFGAITDKTVLVLNDWVGYGDAVDYRQFTVNADASLRFELFTSDQAKFTIYQLDSKTDKKGVTTYSLKALQTTKLHAHELLQTKSLRLKAGEYYFCMESTNAGKGGNAEYEIDICEFSSLPQKGKNASALTEAAEPNGWEPAAGSGSAQDSVLAETSPGSGSVTLGGVGLADLVMSGVEDVSASPIPVSVSEDIFDGLALDPGPFATSGAAPTDNPAGSSQDDALLQQAGGLLA